MLKEESNWAQVCDSCRSAACTVYCHADSAYLCTSCDAHVHAVNRLASRHERVRVCQSCERAPAAFFCKADAASLCTACDSEIHSANPLARRHQRVPILTISGNSYGSMETNHSCETTVTDPENSMVVVGQEEEDRDEAEAASWLLPERSYRGDGVVPLQVDESKSHKHHEELNFELGITYAPPSSSNGLISHMVHVSSIDLGVVPESTTSDSTVSHPISPKAVTDQIPEPPAQMLSPIERQARVMRYREKKKMRKFEKTIRYASRKAYAEKRPRIKGRFAKRKEVDAEADQAFSTTLTFDTGYGIVPSL